jgi:hypothetical protein
VSNNRWDYEKVRGNLPSHNTEHASKQASDALAFVNKFLKVRVELLSAGGSKLQRHWLQNHIHAISHCCLNLPNLVDRHNIALVNNELNTVLSWSLNSLNDTCDCLLRHYLVDDQDCTAIRSFVGLHMWWSRLSKCSLVCAPWDTPTLTCLDRTSMFLLTEVSSCLCLALVHASNTAQNSDTSACI